MIKLLITGTNGFLGQKLLEALRDSRDFDVIATSRQADKTPLLGSYRFESLDITQKEAVASVLAKYQPEVVLHSAAMTQVDQCEKEKEKCWAVNVHGTENLVRSCEKYGTHFIHLSTDYVFDGRQELHREEDTPHPLNYYGVSKWESERTVQNSRLPWSIVRTILIYGVAPYMEKSNIVLNIKNTLEQNRPFFVTDQARTMTLAEDLAGACVEIAKRRKEGIFHISGGEMVAISELAYQIAEVFQLDPRLIQKASTADLEGKAPRPKRSGFVIDKARREIEYAPHSLRQGLEVVRRQLKGKKGL